MHLKEKKKKKKKSSDERVVDRWIYLPISINWFSQNSNITILQLSLY